MRKRQTAPANDNSKLRAADQRFGVGEIGDRIEAIERNAGVAVDHHPFGSRRGGGPVVGLSGASVTLVTSGALAAEKNVQASGAVSLSATAITVARLPKTRSGKILRATMRKITDGEAWTAPSTIEDPAVLSEIEAAVRERGLGPR